jgi:urate oxidase
VPKISRCLSTYSLTAFHSYTKADNNVVVATDSIKNTIYILAKQNPVNPPEVFGSVIGNHFIEKYKHIHGAKVHIITHRWTRMTIDGKPHPHSFFRDGNETRDVQIDVTEGRGIDIASSIKGMLVLKSTGSQFWGYVQDEYTTLKETWDRILSTEVDATWTWKRFSGLADVKSDIARFDHAWGAARRITLKTFAEEDSASVQATMYNMGTKILEAVPGVEAVDYSLPNKHYFEIGELFPGTSPLRCNRGNADCSPDLSFYKGLQNKGKDAEVYAPQWGPSGLIKCTVKRPATAKL